MRLTNAKEPMASRDRDDVAPLLAHRVSLPGRRHRTRTRPLPSSGSGSLVEVNGRVVGSELIAQPFTQPRYFHPRPSAAGAGYDAAASAGTNKGPTDRKLADTLIGGRVDSLRSALGVTGPLPADMVTASASGLDPHISPANAFLQVARVARARGVDSAAVRALVDGRIEGRQFGVFGEPRVNVLLLNIALDSAFSPR